MSDSEAGGFGRCSECGTEAKNTTGVGPYCPNQDCFVVDGLGIEQVKGTDE